MLSGLKIKNRKNTKEAIDKEESTDLPLMLALEDDDVRKGKGLKVSTPKKLLTRIPILLAQLKAENN